MSFKFQKTLGIIGGGQLAKMLILSAQKWGLKTHIFTQSLDDPASTLASTVTLGSHTDKKALSSWLKTCDWVTTESEFVDLEGIKSKKIHPSPKNLNLFRDRLTQKQTLEEFKIPTSPFSLLKFNDTFERSSVLKKRLFGYDGYGTELVKTKNSFTSFMNTSPAHSDWIKEDYIGFTKELAFSLVRGADNSFCTLPLVETKQKNSKCFWVKGPVKNKNFEALLRKAKKMMKELNYIGLLTFELFELKNKSLLINEVAPRVHNSGHYGIEALNLSQFDLHLLAVMGEKLPKKIHSNLDFAMVNLIGTNTKKPVITATDKTSLHWYGKIENRKGRKMGHITCLNKSSDLALKTVLKESLKQKL